MPAKRSILERLWEELDTIVDHIMSEGKPETWENEVGDECANVEPIRTYDNGKKLHTYGDELISEEPSEFQQWAEWRGQAQGVAYAIAMMTDPYAPDIEKIRTQAMKRWEAGE